MQALTVKEEVHLLFMPSTRVAPRDNNSRPLYLFIQGTGVFCFYKGLHKLETVRRNLLCLLAFQEERRIFCLER
jgi:hypothetical protein